MHLYICILIHVHIYICLHVYKYMMYAALEVDSEALNMESGWAGNDMVNTPKYVSYNIPMLLCQYAQYQYTYIIHVVCMCFCVYVSRVFFKYIHTQVHEFISTLHCESPIGSK